VAQGEILEREVARAADEEGETRRIESRALIIERGL
jgi:hypothetical protein